MARTCDNSGFVFLILLQKENLQTPGWERGEPEAPKGGGYRRSVWVIAAASAFLRGRAGPSHQPRRAVCTAPAARPKNIS